MKKNQVFLVVICTVLIALAATACRPSAPQVLVAGKEIVFDPPAERINSMVMVPLQGIADPLGAAAQWDAATRTATLQKGDTTVVLREGSLQATVNGIPREVMASVRIVSGQPYVPLDFVVETIGPAGAAQESTADPALPPAAPEAARLLHVHMLDVGQADSILIQTPGGKTIVIDGGNNADGPAIVEFLKSQGVNKIDALIGTHPHEDHIGGLDDIVESFAIGKIYMPRATANTRSYEDVLTAIQQKGLKITEAKAGVEIDAGPDVSAKLLAPLSAKYDELNDYSAVLKLTYGSTSFLFAGDAGTLSESEMVASGDNLRADVLKVGHHGSRTSSTKKFLNAVMPKVALISVGADNDYGHPAPEALDRLRAIGAEVYRTDKDGPITAVSDGSSVSVKLGE